MQFARESLLWLDADPFRYATLAWLIFSATALAAFLPAPAPAGTRRWWNNPWLYAAGVILALGAFRWPSWFYPRDLNPDESQIIASALTLSRYPLYWKFVDGTSHGPLCEYPLVFASWLGAPFNYVTARILAALLQGGALLALWRTLRCFTSEAVARLAILPGLAFWCLVGWEDFLHYSSELPGIFLLSLAAWPIVLLLDPTAPASRRRWLAALGGCALGLVPFAKLQSMPQALAAGLIAVVLVCRHSATTGQRPRLLLSLILGALLPSLITGCFLLVYGLWGQFWASYILSGLAYQELAPHPLAAMPSRFIVYMPTSPTFAWFFWGGLCFACSCAWTAERQRTLRLGLRLSWLLLGAAFYCVLAPRREAAHYLHLLVVPLTMLTGFSLASAASSAGSPAPPVRIKPKLLFLFLGLTLLPLVYDRAVTWQRFPGALSEHWAEPPSATARYIRERARPEDTLAIWGWEPHLHVETQLPHGTREPHTSSQLASWSMHTFFMVRYVADLEKRRPTWFVDVVRPSAFIYNSRNVHAHEAFPAVAAVIAAQYDYQTEIDGIRIYRLKATRP